MIPQFIEGQTVAFPQLNEIFEQLKAYFLFTRSIAETQGLKLVINGGRYAGTTYADTPLTFTASSTNYVEAGVTPGAITSNTTGYTAGSTRIGVAVMGSTDLISWAQDFTVASTHT